MDMPIGDEDEAAERALSSFQSVEPVSFPWGDDPTGILDLDDDAFREAWSQFNGSGLLPRSVAQECVERAIRISAIGRRGSNARAGYLESLPSDYQGFAQPTRAERSESPAEAANWPEPVDFWGDSHGLPDWRPEQSPEAIAPYIADQADMRGLYPTMQAGCCLWVCSALLQRGIELELQPGSAEGIGWLEKPLLWVAIRGEPGDGKGPAMDAALYRATKIGDRMLAQDLDAWKLYEDKARIHENALQAYYKAAAKNPSTERPESPEKPPKRRILADDVTKEAIARLLVENPRGKVGLVKGELASWFGSFGAYSGSGSEKDRGDWLEAYESKRRFIDRVKEGGSWDVQSWGVPILGGIQPSTLAKIAGKLGDDGMLQRFQVIVSKPKEMRRARPDDAAATEQWNRVCENLAAMEPRGNPVKFSGAAAELFWDCQQWIDRTRAGAPVDPLKFALNKWEGLLGRLAITSHCINDAARGCQVPSPELHVDTLAQCWRWMQEILWPHAHYFYTAGTETAMGKSLQKFGDFLLARPALHELKTGYLTGQWSHYKTLATSSAVREFWDAAQRNGWVRPTGAATNRAGTLPAVFEVNSKIRDGRFSARAAFSAAQVERYRESMPEDFRRGD